MRKSITVTFLDTNETKIKIPLDEYENRFKERFIKGEVSDYELINEMKDYVNEREYDSGSLYNIHDFNHNDYKFHVERINE